ncbi:MAG: hypothetical protein RIS47_1607 [Bacteroidota bacterium]
MRSVIYGVVAVCVINKGGAKILKAKKVCWYMIDAIFYTVTFYFFCIRGNLVDAQAFYSLRPTLKDNKKLWEN